VGWAGDCYVNGDCWGRGVGLYRNGNEKILNCTLLEMADESC
jgi:hypothetical protein